ncbi:MAG TPA: urease accessory UreF family protein [Gammaproteobacteria bacterium]|nr:urease accessory UreF family protein [Gammaproteobacteria bacterium]
MRIERSALMSQLRLWQLVSPALPVGAYSYSQGMETAVENGWVKTEQCVLHWIKGQLRHMLGALDLPVLLRMHKAWVDGDMRALDYWNSWLLAAREASELHAEDCQMGGSLKKLLPELGIPRARDWPAEDKCSFALMFALAAAEWEIPGTDAAAGYAWAWCENQVAAAIKLIPLGQTAGQRTLLALADAIPEVAGSASRLQDEDIGQMSPAFAVACALHETQYTRLFRS